MFGFLWKLGPGFLKKMENHPSKKTLFALPGSLKAWLGRGVGAAGRLPEQQVALRAPRAPLLNPFFSAMAGDGGGGAGSPFSRGGYSEA